jgi:hypothetical protein
MHPGRVFAVLLLCSISAAARAAPTALNLIPTADLVPFHQITLSLQNGNTSLQDSPTLFHQPQFLPQLQFGLGPTVEGGIDAIPAHPPRDYQPQFNLKWKPLAEDYNRPAVGIGVAQVGPGFSPSYYLVAGRTLNYQQIQYQKFRAHHRNIKLRGRRVHVGITHGQGRTFPMLGTDWEISDRFVLYSDWISGMQNAISLGGVFIINADNSIQAALLYGNHQQRINGLLINYSRTLKW